MSKTHSPYAPEYRRQMVELVRAGRSAGELARELGCCAQTIRNWVRQTEPSSVLSGSTTWRSTAAFTSYLTHRSWEDFTTTGDRSPQYW